MAKIQSAYDKKAKEQQALLRSEYEKKLAEVSNAGNDVGTLRQITAQIAAAHVMHPGHPEVAKLAHRAGRLTSKDYRANLRRSALANGIHAHMANRGRQ